MATTSFSPDKNKCAQYASGTAKYYTSFGYTYFNGNCSSSGDCTTDTSSVCALYSGEAVDTYNASTKAKGSVTCKFTSGCKTGFFPAGATPYVCGTSSLNTATYFQTETSNTGSASCKKITGCISPYVVAFIGPKSAAGSTDYASANGVSYDVKRIESGDAYVICRQAIGCVAPKYSQEACYYADGTNYGPPNAWTPQNLGL